MAFLWGLCARALVLPPQFHLLAKHQAPSASLHILPCFIPSKEAGAPFYTWDHCVILVMLHVFPFLKGCLLSGTHHFQVSTLPASSRLLDTASSSLRTPRHASFLFLQDRREAEPGGWHSRKQKCGPFSWKAPNLLPLQPQSTSCANSWLTEILKCHQELKKAKGKCLFEVVKMK